jgi:hypothetical protein
MGHLCVEQALVRGRTRSDISALLSDLRAGAREDSWVVEAGHFTVPYPMPTAYFQSEWVFRTISAGFTIGELLRQRGSLVSDATLVGDLSYPPEHPTNRINEAQPGFTRTSLPRADLPLDLSSAQWVAESRARDKGKRLLNRLRHRLTDEAKSEELFAVTGGVLLQEQCGGPLFFSANGASVDFNQPPAFTQLTRDECTVPLCPLIVAGKYLVLFASEARNVVSVYDRREDLDIRAKNFWGACVALFLLGSLPQGSDGVIVNLTYVADDLLWADRIWFERAVAPASHGLTHFLDELALMHAGRRFHPYTRPPRRREEVTRGCRARDIPGQ